MDHASAVVPTTGEIEPAGWRAGLDDMFAEVVAPQVTEAQVAGSR
jgi:hypothetical protein